MFKKPLICLLTALMLHALPSLRAAEPVDIGTRRELFVDDLLIGEWVIAIGNPFGNMMRDNQPSVSVGSC